MKSARVFALATGNRHKVQEIGEILKNVSIELRGIVDFPGFEPPQETALDLEGNALIKARALAKFSGIASIADDTGLEVDALGGAPGVRSARYSGPQATAQTNVEKLLREMGDVPDGQRTARFRCVIALCDPQGQELLFKGTVEGAITRSPKGAGGFGYDSVFLPLGYGETFAELPMEEKNKISHRGKALAELKKYLAGGE